MSEASSLPLPSPWALAARLSADEAAARALAAAGAALAEAPAVALRRLDEVARAFAAPAALELPQDTGTPLSRDEVQDFDRRFRVQRCAGAALPVPSFVIALRRFMRMAAARPDLHERAGRQIEGFACHAALLARCAALPSLPAVPAVEASAGAEATPPSIWSLWEGFHWVFFIDVQGLVLSLLRFDAADDDAAAMLELDTASALLLASGNAMELAADFAPQVYRDEVRPAMMPPHVASDRFSGLMVWDHARLVRLWQQLRPRFAALPAALQPAHQRFVEAYRAMMAAHRGVCARFAGESGGSLRSRGDSTAVQTLDRIAQLREELIAPETKS